MTTAAKSQYLRLLGQPSPRPSDDRAAPVVSRRDPGQPTSAPGSLGPASDAKEWAEQPHWPVPNVPLPPDSAPEHYRCPVNADRVGERELAVVDTVTPRSPIRTGEETADRVPIDNDTELEATWGRFKREPSQADRDELIVFYAPLVKYVASRIAAGLPRTVDQADLMSYGMFGLIDAITKFEPDRGFKFETYAVSRIKGSILDELRSIDWVPRSVRSKAKSVERAISKLESKNHRPPTDEEIAAELDLSMGQLHNIYKQIGALSVVALDEILSSGTSETLTFGDTLADRREGPGSTVEKAETRQLLAEALNLMSEREKIVLTLYYYENMTLAEIGGVLGVTESRVCQIHTKAILRLRSRFESSQREPVS